MVCAQSSWRSRRKSQADQDEVGGYFLASRNMDFYLVMIKKGMGNRGMN